ncbi:hypothetical protein XENTR_v10016696 [Xenopus tropicalis]|nr:hypothetical protein XENTR_v10016696 [Xenopus tropicalis]
MLSCVRQRWVGVWAHICKVKLFHLHQKREKDGNVQPRWESSSLETFYLQADPLQSFIVPTVGPVVGKRALEIILRPMENSRRQLESLNMALPQQLVPMCQER